LDAIFPKFEYWQLIEYYLIKWHRESTERSDIYPRVLPEQELHPPAQGWHWLLTWDIGKRTSKTNWHVGVIIKEEVKLVKVVYAVVAVILTINAECTTYCWSDCQIIYYDLTVIFFQRIHWVFADPTNWTRWITWAAIVCSGIYKVAAGQFMTHRLLES